MTLSRRRVAPRFGVVVLFLVAPFSAQAECEGHWDLSGVWRLPHSNGYLVDLVLSQKSGKLTGSATYDVEADPRVVSGNWLGLDPFPTRQFGSSNAGRITRGLITGDTVTFSLEWQSGAIGEYSGTVQENGMVAGLAYDRTSPGNAANWSSDRAAICVASKSVDPVNPKKLVPRSSATKPVDPDNPKQLVPRSSATKPVDPDNPKKLVPRPMATVTSDVDVYDEPGGEGNVIGMLRAGDQVSAKCREDQWCSVRGDEGQGWVWGEFLAF